MKPSSDPNRLQRWVDRCNPVLVRDIQTWIRSKLLLTAIALGCLALLFVSMQGMQTGFSDGLTVFEIALRLVVPVVLLAVPMHAYGSMIEEMHEGVLDQLVLTRLSPRRIIYGKMASSLAQFFFFLCLLLPLIALAFTMRGVGFGLISFYVAFSLMAAISASALAVLLATLARTRLLQNLGQLVILIGLGSATIGLMAEGMRDLRYEVDGFLNEPDLPVMMLCCIWGWICGTILLIQCAAAMLAHPYENRSTAFRLFLPVLFVTGVLCLLLTVKPVEYRDAFPAFALVSTLTVGVFGLFATTEEESLTPRQSSQVHARPSLAPLLAPYLPGRSRGLLFTLTWLVPALLLATFGPELLGGTAPRPFILNTIWQAGLYMWIYLAMNYQLRKRLPERALSNWMARGSFWLLLCAGCLLPLFSDLLIGTEPYRVFEWQHIGNPFYVFAAGWSDIPLQHQILWVLSIAAGVLFALSIPDFVRGIREVNEAALHHRDALAMKNAATRPETDDAS